MTFERLAAPHDAPNGEMDDASDKDNPATARMAASGSVTPLHASGRSPGEIELNTGRRVMRLTDCRLLLAA
jgi:hypothetical protein